MSHTNLCRTLQRLLDRFCPPEPPPKMKMRFGRPEPKTENDEIRVALVGVLNDLDAPLGASKKGATMADFVTGCDNTQKVRVTVSLTKPAPDNSPVPVTSLTILTQSGDGTSSQSENDGTAMPLDQFFAISGPSAGATVFVVDAYWSATIQPVRGTLTLNVIDGTPIMTMSFGSPENK